MSDRKTIVDDSSRSLSSAFAGGEAQPNRVSVLIGSESVPLFPGAPVSGSELSPWSGLILERHHHGPVAIPEHEHSTFCLHLQTSGPIEMDWNSAGKTGRIKSGAGNLIFLTPGTKDSILWHGASQRIVASIHPSLLTQAATELEVRNGAEFENSWSFRDMQLSLLLTEMDREMNSGWAMGSLYGDLLAMSLSIALIKKYGHSLSAPVVLKGGLSRPRLRQVVAYIDENLHRNLQLQELATLSGLSMFHFARSFRESTGVTPHQYLLKRRIDRAKTLLLQPAWNVQQVASATGFADGSQFSKAFRKAIGATPSQWRQAV